MADYREFELLFETMAKRAGFIIKEADEIVCSEPVNDRNGRKRKTVTLPDWHVYHSPNDPRHIYVEVTTGSTRAPTKRAQKRVVSQAEKEKGESIPYCVVTALILEKLVEMQNDYDALRLFFLTLFGWLNQD